MSKRIILFRLHKDFDVCLERILLLKKYNPDLPIYGLYGGTSEHVKEAELKIGEQIEHLYIDKHTDSEWKWLHPDISLKEWYRDVGKSYSFDYMYDYEWDILTLDSLEKLYPQIEPKTLYFSAVKKLTPEVKEKWDWTSEQPHKFNYIKFIHYMKKTFGDHLFETAVLGPAPLLSRSFIDQFSQTEDIDWVLNEISYPAYAEAFGYTIKDNGFHPGWFTSEARTYFNCHSDAPIAKDTILSELAKPNGRRVFHPVKYVTGL